MAGKRKKRFVIHEHHARNLHFDLRLEIDGVLRSWAISKGISMDPADKRLAVAVPDHALSYIGFEGTLEEGTYGAGEVRIWDKGDFEASSDPDQQLKDGKLEVKFFGAKMRGAFTFIKLKNQNKNWLVIKVDDEFANDNWKLETVLPAHAARKRPQAKKKKV